MLQTNSSPRKSGSSDQTISGSQVAFSIGDELTKLSKFRDDKSITEQEFQDIKQKLISKLGKS